MKKNMIQVSDVVQLQTLSLPTWVSAQKVTLTHQGILGLIEENHAFNYQLWTTEDKARRDDMGYQFVYEAKRQIDYLNQQRNNRVESIDDWLYDYLCPESSEDCPVHSETPGMMIDRLSILSLKIYHMALQVNRADVDEAHRATCQQKVFTLEAQRTQLARCLEHFFTELQEKRRTFKIYRQFKMYNDPTLNPELYLKEQV